jgi:predicted porin
MTIEAVNGQALDPNLPAGSAPVNRTLYRVNSNSSRLGVRGTESLGGGLSAIFQIESSVNADISGGVLASRETFVGLQGTWGTVKVGYFLAPYDDIHPIFGNVPTLTTSILSTAALWAQGSQSNDNGGFDNRVANSLRYDSPRIGGFTGSIQVGAYDFSPASGGGGTTFGTDAQAKRHAYVGSAGGFYANGPFQAGVAYQWNQKLRGPSLNDYALSVAANWNFGPVKIGGVWERLDYDVLNNSDLTRNFYALSATVPIGPGELYAFFGTARNGSGPTGAAVGQVRAGSNTGADQWEISYTYALSKRSLLYAGFVQTRNDDNAAYNFNINPYTVVNGANANGFVVGMVHFF